MVDGAKILQMKSGTPSEKPIRQGTRLQYNKRVVAAGMSYGLPRIIRGNPLGCGCRQGYLVGVGDIIDGRIEADYSCDSKWHNYVLFEVEQLKQGVKLKYDTNGNIIEEEGYQADELEDF